ncbi:hypothetical protein HZA87_02965 [Candidatus Uhrbacteria bacterium]|nr:hypothetical protein [Candidatus Uhrbacteria bacterium]
MINVNIVNAAVFIAVAVLHGVRLLTGADVNIGGIEIAPWLSAVAIVGAVVLAWWNLKSLPAIGKREILRLIQALAAIDAFICFYSWVAGLSYWGFSGSLFLWGIVFDAVVILVIAQALKKS